MHRLRLLLAFNLLLTAACTDSNWQQPIADQIAKIDETRLRTHVDTLTRAGPRSLEHMPAIRHSVAYIRTQLMEYGYQSVEETVTAGEDTFVNIIAEHAGTTVASKILELGAHYDTVRKSPGADDNASGVSAVLEIARILAPLTTGRTIRFCFFAREESGRDGSRLHVRNIREKREDLEGMIIFEMIGYATDAPDTQATPARIPLLFSPPTTGNFIAVVGNIRSGTLGNRFEAAVDSYVPALPYFSANRLGGFLGDALRSDHKAYWDHGYRAIMLTDTANFRNPHYHQPSDTSDTLDYTFLRQIARATAATLIEMAGSINP